MNVVSARGHVRSLVAGVLALALCVALLPMSGPVAADAQQPVSRFSDVPAGHAFEAEIGWLASTGITQGRGDGTFGLNDPVTRGAMAAFVYRFSGQPAVPVTGRGFTDVPAGHVFEAEIGWLASTGITQGRGDGSFGLNDAVTRGAMAAFLYRAAGEPHVAADARSFADVPVGHVFAEEIAWLASTGITQGRDDGTFGLNDAVTRGQMAAFLFRFDDWLLPGPGSVFALPGDGQAQLGWIAVPLADVGYRVQRAPSRSGPWDLIEVTAAGIDALTVEGLTNGQDVFLRVRAQDASGRTSLVSEPVGVVPVALPAIDPQLTDGTVRVTRSQVLAASAAGEGRSLVTVDGEVPIDGPGQLLVIEPSAPMPRGMLAEVLEVTDAAQSPGQQLLLANAAMDEVFIDPQIDWDVPLVAQPVDDVGSALLSSAPQRSVEGGVSTVGLPTGAFSCSGTGGVPLSPDEVWETGNPFPVQLELREPRVLQRFDPGSRLFNRDPLLLLQFSGQVVTTVGVSAKVGVTCELSSEWRRNHPIFSAYIGTVGGVPVQVSLEPAFSISITTSGHVGFTETRYFSYTVEKADGQPIEFRRAGSADPPEFTATAGITAEVFAGGDLSVLFGGGVGPATAAAGLFLEFGPALTAAITTDNPNCITLDLAFNATGGIRLELWVERWDLELASATYDFGQLAERCLPTDDEPDTTAALPGVAADLDGYRSGQWSDPWIDGGWQRVDYRGDDQATASLRVRRLPDWWAAEALRDAFVSGESWFQGFEGVEVRPIDGDERFPDAQRGLMIGSTAIYNEGWGGPWAAGDERRYLLDHGDHVVEVLWRSRNWVAGLPYSSGVVVDPAGEALTDSLRVTADGTAELGVPVDPSAVDWRNSSLDYRDRPASEPPVGVTLIDGGFDAIAPDGRRLQLTLLDVAYGDATDDGNLEALLLFESSRTEHPFATVMAAEGGTWRQRDVTPLPSTTVRLVAVNEWLFAVSDDDRAIEARRWLPRLDYFEGVG